MRYWLPLIAYCVFIFVQSSGEAPVDLPGIPVVDKVLHAGGYGLLGILFYRAYRPAGPRLRVGHRQRQPPLGIRSTGSPTSCTSAFVPSRTADPFDWLADTLGALLGIAAYAVFLRLWSRRNEHGRASAQLTKRVGSDR